jgi:hypothetical protein
MKRSPIGAVAAGLIVVTVCILTRALSGWTPAAVPQTTAVPASTQLPFGDLLASDEFKKTFAAHQFTPFGDGKFSFSIFIPNTWESRVSEVDPDQITHDTEAPVPLAEFAPGGADDVGINVQYLRVPADKPLTAVIDDYAKTNNGTLVARQHLDSRERSIEDALMKSNADDLGAMLTRVSVVRRGAIVFIYTGWSVEAKYEKSKRIFGAALESFVPTGN